MNLQHVSNFISSLRESDDTSDVKVKIFCPRRNFDAIIDVKKLYLVNDSSGDDFLLFSSEDLVSEHFNEVDF